MNSNLWATSIPDDATRMRDAASRDGTVGVVAGFLFAASPTSEDWLPLQLLIRRLASPSAHDLLHNILHLQHPIDLAMSQYEDNTTRRGLGGSDNKGRNEFDNDPHHSTMGVGSGHKQSHQGKNDNMSTPYGGSSSSSSTMTGNRTTTTGDNYGNVSGSSSRKHDDDDKHKGIGSKIADKLGMGHHDKDKESSGSLNQQGYQSKNDNMSTPYGGSSTSTSTTRGQDNTTGNRTTTTGDNYGSGASSRKHDDDDKHKGIGSKIADKLGMGHHDKDKESSHRSKNDGNDSDDDTGLVSKIANKLGMGSHDKHEESRDKHTNVSGSTTKHGQQNKTDSSYTSNTLGGSSASQGADRSGGEYGTSASRTTANPTGYSASSHQGSAVQGSNVGGSRQSGMTQGSNVGGSHQSGSMQSSSAGSYGSSGSTARPGVQGSNNSTGGEYGRSGESTTTGYGSSSAGSSGVSGSEYGSNKSNYGGSSGSSLGRNDDDSYSGSSSANRATGQRNQTGGNVGASRTNTYDNRD